MCGFLSRLYLVLQKKSDCFLSLAFSLCLCPLQTERTMTELEIAVNQRVGEWEVIQESGTTLRPLWGPGLTGMKNLGNSCYLNSVMQVLFTIPDFQEKSVPLSFCYCLVFLSLLTRMSGKHTCQQCLAETAANLNGNS